MSVQKEIEEYQKIARQMVLDSLEDVKDKKGREFNEVIDELEKKLIPIAE